MRNELIIGGYPCDTIEDIDINITKEIYSLDDPSKRQSDFSKTIDIPNSKQNSFVFKSLFDVSFSIRNSDQLNPDFNPTKKATCIYYQDNNSLITGYCQLNEIKIVDVNNIIYNITIYGSNIDLFSKITNLTLNDLTTLGTAVWNDTNIVDSWTDTFDPTIKMVYPMLDRGKSVYGRFTDPIFKLSYNYEAFKPWMYVKHIINAIFNEAGISLDVAAFFETAQFTKLILECDVTRFQQDQVTIQQTAVEASRNSTQVITPVSAANSTNLSLIWDKQIIWNIVNTDPSSQYDNTTGTFTMVEDAYTNFVTEFTADVQHLANGSVNFIAIRKRGSVYTPIGGLFSSQLLSGAATTNDVPYRIDIDSSYLLTGDEVRICLSGYSSGNGNLTQVSIDSSGNYFKQFQDGQINYGQTFDIASVLPNMKQTEFLMGIVKMFNLYFEPINVTGLVVEPRDDFFTDEIIDWTYKLDTSKEFKIVPQGLLENKEILFTYVNNEDDLSKNFKEATEYAHGFKDLIFDNDFVKDKKKVEIPFCLIPLQKDDDNNVMMRTIFSGKSQEKSVKPIIAYFGGMKDGILRYYDITGTYTDYTTYPFAGHVDDLLAPNYDLAFDLQPLYFYTTPSVGGLNITNNNQYNQFHQRQWTEIGDKDSKLIEAYFRLTPNDISQLSFRPTYWIENNGYRLLSVEDFDPQNDKTTLCKLLKLNVSSAITPSVSTNSGGNGQGGNTSGSGDTLGYGDIGNVIKKGVLSSGGSTIGGSAVGVIVQGRGNVVPSESGNIFIIGEGNIIMPSVTNVTLINCTDLVINESDVVYIDNIKVSVGTPSDGQVWTYDSTTNSIKFETPTGGGGGITWNEITAASDSMAVDNGYITNRATPVALLLPSTAAIGKSISVVGNGAGGWIISQNANQVIVWNNGGVVGTNQTTTGIGGSLASTDRYDSIELICLEVNLKWGVRLVKGNITLV